jgi:sec-independent protein translocase protein TatA
MKAAQSELTGPCVVGAGVHFRQQARGSGGHRMDGTNRPRRASEEQTEVNVFGLGAPEIIIILVVALLVFGPKKLPDLGRSLGQGIREFKRGTAGLKEELESSFKDEPDKVELKKDAAASEPVQVASAPSVTTATVSPTGATANTVNTAKRDDEPHPQA